MCLRCGGAREAGFTSGQSLFDQEQIQKCLLNTVWKTEIAQLIATAGSIVRPTIDGFIDDGLDTVVNIGSQVAMTAYRDSILRALPGIFQLKLRENLNRMIDNYFNDPDNVSCPAPASSSGDRFVDLRDLLLTPADAISAGGSGTSPYGDIISGIKSLFDDMIVEYDPVTETSKINEAVIVPITVSQSGIPGTFSRSEDFFTVQFLCRGLSEKSSSSNETHKILSNVWATGTHSVLRFCFTS